MHENTNIRTSVGPVASLFGKVCLRLMGWREASPQPAVPKYVLTAAPHTTNMDLFYMLFGTLAMKIPATWMMKDTAFWWPAGIIWRKLGGVPVNRRAATNVVHQIVDVFNSREDLALLIAPEGTRKEVKHWKLGFYWMALQADVPIVPGYINHKTKRIGVGEPIYLTGDIEQDFQKLRDFYRDLVDIYPDYDERQAKRPPVKRGGD